MSTIWCGFIDEQRSTWIRTLQKHVKNFEESPETWKKVVQNTPFEIIKQLALTVKQFQHSTHYEPLHYAAISGNLGLYKYIHDKMEDKIPQTGSKAHGLFTSVISLRHPGISFWS